MTRPRTLPLALLGAGLLIAACGPTHAQLARGGAATAPAATASPSPSPSPTVDAGTPTPAPATPVPTSAATPIPTPRPPTAPPAPPAFSAFPLPNAAATALVAGGDGNLWWVDPNVPKVMRTTPRGVTTAFGIPSGQQPRPQLVAAPDGSLWTADFGGKLVHVTLAGTVTEVDVPAAGGTGPYDVAPASDGAIWYVGGSPVSLFRRDPAGITNSYPLNGVSPASLIWGPDHALWFGEAIYPVGSSPHQGIARFDPATSTVQHFPLPGPPDFVGPPIFAADGNLWFGEEAAGKVVRMTPQGTVTEFPTPPANGGRLVVAGLVAARDGTLWASASGAGAPVVLHLTLAGAIQVVTVTGIPGAEPYVNGVAPGPDGHMWMLAGHGYQARTGGADLVRDNQA